MLIGHELPAPGCAQSGTEFVPAVPRKAVVQGRADDRMPKRVARAPFLQEGPICSARSSASKSTGTATGGSSAAAPARSWFSETSAALAMAVSPSTRRRGSSMSDSRIAVRARLSCHRPTSRDGPGKRSHPPEPGHRGRLWRRRVPGRRADCPGTVRRSPPGYSASTPDARQHRLHQKVGAATGTSSAARSLATDAPASSPRSFAEARRRPR
jgi:hypothetical protein